MIFSDLSWSIRGTLGRKYLALAQQYDDVVNFTLGDPDIPTPEGICEAEFIKRLVKMQENVAVCASSISQWAALEAITHADQYYPPILEKFRARRKVLLDALEGIPHLKYAVPDATFYLFTDISETGLDSRAMCAALLEKEHVAITPGLSFGDAFDGYIRLAFTLEDDVIREGIGRIRHFMENLN